jgi:diguanylate cyclase (GGDEF)-like protein
LSGLPNRRAFLETAERELARAHRYKRPLSLLLIDIDHFKGVNDRFGHAVGDQAISHMAKTLESVLRTADFAGRLGGEEFVILLPDTDAHGATELAERLRQTVRSQSITSHGLTLTVSIGVAASRGADDTVASVLAAADNALYQAKRGGRDRVSGEARSQLRIAHSA